MLNVNKNLKIDLKKILILTFFLQMMFIWHIDVSTGAIVRDGILTNGFFNFDPMIIYHISLYGIIIISLLLVFLAFDKTKSYGETHGVK